jgi:hypothetical protein
VPGEFGPIIEILSTRPLTPKIQVVDQPLRLVVDLPGSTLGSARTRVPFRNEQVKSVRVNQYQSSPAVTRIVVDLAAPVLYNWDASGNRLNIRIRPDEAAKAKPPAVPGFSAGVEPVAVPVAVGDSGTLVETGSRVASGTSITAGDETAVLRLTRGGEVRVCPGTTVSVATSPNGPDLMLGMSRGAMETHYGLSESLDSILTPDFRIVLPGPGEFNLAVSTDTKGNTCVSALPGNTASAVVAELLGNGTYEIKPDQQVLFRQGRLDSVETPVASCGCPPAPVPVLRTQADPANLVPEDQAGTKVQLSTTEGAVNRQLPPDESPVPASDDTAKSGATDPVEAPLVFSGVEMAKARQEAATHSAAKSVPAAPTHEAATLQSTEHKHDPLPAVVVLPPAEQKPKGFFGKLRGFFGAIFH